MLNGKRHGQWTVPGLFGFGRRTVTYHHGKKV